MPKMPIFDFSHFEGRHFQQQMQEMHRSGFWNDVMLKAYRRPIKQQLTKAPLWRPRAASCTQTRLAAYLGMSTAKLARIHSMGAGPRTTEAYGDVIAYEVKALDAWKHDQAVNATKNGTTKLN